MLVTRAPEYLSIEYGVWQYRYKVVMSCIVRCIVHFFGGRSSGDASSGAGTGNRDGLKLVDWSPQYDVCKINPC